MPLRTPIFIVSSPRPRVGKTLLARVLAEFFRAEGRPFAAFDVNPGDFALVDYLPGDTAAATINDTMGQVALFDQLLIADHVPKVVDLAHGLFDKFFSIVQEIDFAEEARRRSIALIVLVVADADRRARQGYDMVRMRFPDMAVVPVVNEALPQSFTLRDNFPPTRHGGAALTIPAISPVIRGVIERPGFSFSAYSKAADPSTELFHWTRRVFLEFRELELRQLLDEMKPRLRS